MEEYLGGFIQTTHILVCALDLLINNLWVWSYHKQFLFEK